VYGHYSECCERKELVGCWECDEFEECGRLKELEAGHGQAHIKNLRRIRRNGVGAFLKGKRD
jgi:hypothetical protein